MFNSCGYTGHSTRDCKHRAKGASAFQKLPYDKQNTDENKKFRKEFNSSHKRAPVNENTEQHNRVTSLRAKIQKYAILHI